MPINTRSATLRKHQGEIKKLADETQRASLAAEDALTALEDREARRAGRTTVNQDRMDAIRDRR